MEQDVVKFLAEFESKKNVFGILFRDDRPKNSATLLRLEITTKARNKIIEGLTVKDYVEGPIEDKLYHQTDMWVFGKVYRDVELYIKVTIGQKNNPVICISFHAADYALNYPLKNKKT